MHAFTPAPFPQFLTFWIGGADLDLIARVALKSINPRATGGHTAAAAAHTCKEIANGNGRLVYTDPSQSIDRAAATCKEQQQH